MAVVEKRIDRTIGNLKNNKMDAYYAETCADAVALVRQLCPAGQTVSCGGSVTLEECGVKKLLRSGEYTFLDREAKGADPEDIPPDVWLRHIFAAATRLRKRGSFTTWMGAATVSRR